MRESELCKTTLTIKLFNEYIYRIEDENQDRFSADENIAKILRAEFSMSRKALSSLSRHWRTSANFIQSAYYILNNIG